MPETYDLLITEAALPGREEPVAIAIAGGRIAAIGPQVDGAAAERIDARGLTVLPGGIDPHVHFNEPGFRGEWEGWETGSAALAAGGVTTTIEMPLNAHPPTVSVAAFDQKLAAIAGRSRVDYALWGGIVPGNRGELAGLADRGVVAFKAFMSATGVDDFVRADDLTLLEGMTEAARLGLPVGVHAENDAITGALAARALAEGRRGVRDYLASRPVVAETEAIARAIELAQAAGCALHIVHVSTGRGVALVAEARAQGLDVSCEVTAHHLVLTEEDAERLGTLAKCAPPLRPAGETAALWEHLAAGRIACVVSDHSPGTPELCAGDSFSAWGGITGCQSTLELLLTEGVIAGRLAPEAVGVVFAAAAAERFGLPGKGLLEAGADADLVLVRLGEERVLAEAELRYRHPAGPYTGRTLRARVAATILRGAPSYREDAPVGEPRGRLIRPRPRTRS